MRNHWMRSDLHLMVRIRIKLVVHQFYLGCAIHSTSMGYPGSQLSAYCGLPIPCCGQQVDLPFLHKSGTKSSTLKAWGAWPAWAGPIILNLNALLSQHFFHLPCHATTFQNEGFARTSKRTTDWGDRFRKTLLPTAPNVASTGLLKIVLERDKDLGPETF